MINVPTDTSPFPPALWEFLPDIQQNTPSPRMLHLLTSNEAPTETEMEEFQALITQSSSYSRLLAEKVSVTKDLLEFLVKQRKQAKANRADAKLILHPMRRLPYDVLETIFTYTSAAFDDSLDAKHAPWTLSHVCRQWRFTALSIPHLWTTLDISLSKAPSQYRLQLCLERSKERPLDVCLTFRRSHVETHTSVLDVLYPSSPRWVELRLEVPFDCLRDMESRVRLPKLKKVTVVHRPIEEVAAVVARSSLFSASLQLKSLNASVNFPFFRFTFHGQKITYFRSMHDRLLDNLYALQHMPNLREAIVHCQPSMRALTYPRVVTMKKLRTLQIFEARDMASGVTRAADLFDFLELPALKRLTLDVVPPSARFPQIRPAPTTLTNLTIVIDQVQTSDSLIAFLHTTPNVKRFILRCAAVPPDLVRSLTANLSASSTNSESEVVVAPILPKLDEISFQGLPAGLNHGTTVLLVALALSRRRNETQGGCANLQVMGLDAPMVLCDNDLMLEAWRRLREDGLRVPCSHAHRGCN